MENGVSQHMAEAYGIEVTPGKKGKCPFCGKQTFAVKHDDTLAKCFHEQCGRYVTAKMAQDRFGSAMQRALQRIMLDCKSALRSNSPEGEKALKYLVEERKIDERVINQTYIGRLSAELDITEAFQEAIHDLEAAARRSRNEENQKQVISEINSLEEMRDNLVKVAKLALNWLCFFYTDQHLNITSIRFRKPYSREFKSWAGSEVKGVFGLPLVAISEDQGPLVVLEGEFNLLRLQSIEAQKSLGVEGCLNAVAVGSASSPDFGTVMALSSMPLFVYDNDTAGAAVINSALDKMHLKACTTPLPVKDLDEYIGSLDGDPMTVSEAVHKLLSSADVRYQYQGSIAAEILRVRKGSGPDFIIFQRVTDIIVSDLRVRTRFLQNGGTGYLFNLDSKVLVPIEKASPEYASLLARYGINQSEKVYSFIFSALCTVVYNEGESCEPRRFAHYCRESNRLYISRGGNGVIRISTTSIETVDNGTDGCLFLNGEDATMPPISTDERSGFLDSLLVSKINFAESELTRHELGELFMVWVKALFFSSLLKTKPIVVWLGEKGSGKSITIRKVGILLFGERFDVTPLPRDPKDFDVLASTSHLFAIDNADTRSDWLEDKMAVISTGGVIKARKLYTDNQTVELRPQCFLALTARTPKFRRDDIADRVLVMPLKRIEAFSPEGAILEEILTFRKEMLGELFTSLQRVLRVLPDPRAPKYQGGLRMADFADFALKVGYAEEKLEVIQGVLAKLSNAQAQFTLELDTIVDLLVTWVDKPGNSRRWVTNRELYLELQKQAQELGEDFSYKNHRSFAQRMSNIRPNLKTMFDIEEKSVGGRVVKFNFRNKQSPMMLDLF